MEVVFTDSETDPFERGSIVEAQNDQTQQSKHGDDREDFHAARGYHGGDFQKAGPRPRKPNLGPGQIGE